jgi:hypothetical protein
VLAFSFRGECLFTTRTFQKTVFLPREFYILSMLDVLVMYINFRGFKKYRVSTQILNRVTLQVYQKMSVHGNVFWKFIFHPHETHILTRLDVIILYTIFLGPEKYRIQAQNLKGLVSLWLYQQTYIHNENRPKIRISSSWCLYSISVRHIDVVHKFLGVSKNIEFRLKTKRG